MSTIRNMLAAFGLAAGLSYGLAAMSSFAQPDPGLAQAVSLARFTTIARINGTPVRANVDACADTIIIPWEQARRLGLDTDRLDFTQVVATPRGFAQAAFVKLHQLDVNGMRLQDVRALVYPKGIVSRVLIGLQYLAGSPAAHALRARGAALTPGTAPTPDTARASMMEFMHD